MSESTIQRAIAYTLAIRTSNPNNGATGNTRLAAIIRSRKRAGQRRAAWAQTLAMVGLDPWATIAAATLPQDASAKGTRPTPSRGGHGAVTGHPGRPAPMAERIVVTLTRVAPSGGLDPHDGLGAALKGIIDGVADGLGLKNDRDPRVVWSLAQRRGPAGVYAVEVEIRAASARG